MVVKIIKLEENELEQINGGAVPFIWIGIGVAAIIIFLSGFIDGIVNPKECGNG